MVCRTIAFFPRTGGNQGGVLSRRLFSICYDDLVNILYATGSGILFKDSNQKFVFICVLIYADDILLIAKSPYGLLLLIQKSLSFANVHGDIVFKRVHQRVGYFDSDLTANQSSPYAVFQHHSNMSILVL